MTKKHLFAASFFGSIVALLGFMFRADALVWTGICIAAIMSAGGLFGADDNNHWWD